MLLGKLPDNADFWGQEFVHLAFLHRWLHAGELPLWNPQLAAGTPHLADPQSAVLYPLTTLPLLLFSPDWVERLLIPFHHALAGALTYGYARQVGLGRAGALVAGLSYELAPHFAPIVNATYLQQSGAWVPAILWALHRGLASSRIAPFALAGLVWALQLTRGYPQTWYVTGLLAAAYVLAWGAGQRTRVRTIVIGGVVFALVGLGAAAVQLLPSAELMRASQRSGAFPLAEAAGRGAVRLSHLLGLAGPEKEVSGAFPGGFAVGLALMALLGARPPQRERWLHAGLAAVGLALSLGSATPLWGLLYHVVPGFTVLHMPHRSLFVWSLGLAVLAGMGADALRERIDRTAFRSYVIAAGALIGTLALAAGDGFDAASLRGITHLGTGIALVALAALLHAFASPRWLPYLAWALPSIVAIDLLIHTAPRLHGHFYPPDALYATPPLAAWLQERSVAAIASRDGPFRFSAEPGAAESTEWNLAQDNRRLAFLPLNTPALYAGLDAAAGYLAIRQQLSDELFQRINDLGTRPLVLTIYDYRSRPVDLLNVRYIVADRSETFRSVVGQGRSLAPGERASIDLLSPSAARSLELRSNLGDSVDVADGEVVGEVVVLGRDGSELRFAVRAGEHTAEWRYAAEGVAGRVRHRMAPVATAIGEGSERTHVYRAEIPLAPLGGTEVSSIRFASTHPRARWNVASVALHVPYVARFRLAHADGVMNVWENPDALPRAWWVGSSAARVTVNADADLLPGSESSATVRWTAYTAGTRELEVDAPAPGYVVLSETFAPGWRAHVDGASTPVHRANVALQAVRVPAGRSDLRLTYLPLSVIVGAVVSATTVAGAVGWLLLSRKRA